MKPYILLTNDDGIFSPGLHAMAEAVADLGELLIAAPHSQQTSMGRSFPRTPEQGIIERVQLSGLDDAACYCVYGSPAYAVAHAVLELADRKPDLCLCGINYGENLGTTVTCSGTLGAAFEANTHGIPAIAVSLEAPLSIQRKRDYPEYNWTAAQEIARKMVQAMWERGFPPQCKLLNINVPLAAESGTQYKMTRLSNQNYFNYLLPPERDFGSSFELKCERSVDLQNLEPDSDIYATYVQHMISVTPMSLDMTVNSAMEWKI